MKIYWVNRWHYVDDDDNDAYVDDTEFYATRELAQREADRLIEQDHQAWEKRTKSKAAQYALNEQARAVLKEANIEINLPYVYEPPAFNHHIAVEEIDVITVVTY